MSCYFYFVLFCSECDVMSLYVLCCSVNVSVCLVCCEPESIYERQTIHDVLGCGCCFVAECYGCV